MAANWRRKSTNSTRIKTDAEWPQNAQKAQNEISQVRFTEGNELNEAELCFLRYPL
jgi:hypothetical protein